MASNVASTAGFTSANMKPASGEQIDALWGQNIADNTGNLRQRPNYFINGYGTEGTYRNTIDPVLTIRHDVYFNRWAGHNYLYGTFVGTGIFTDNGGPDCYATQGFYIYGNLGTYGGTSTLGTANIGGDYAFGSTFAFGVDISSYVSVGSWATLTLYYSGTITDSSSSANEARYQYGTPCKAYTTWVG